MMLAIHVAASLITAHYHVGLVVKFPLLCREFAVDLVMHLRPADHHIHAGGAALLGRLTNFALVESFPLLLIHGRLNLLHGCMML